MVVNMVLNSHRNHRDRQRHGVGAFILIYTVTITLIA